MDALETLGLGSRERLCYTALLRLGPSTTGPLIERTGIPSSKIYEVLSRLAAKGLVSHALRGRVKEYRAADPEFLLHIADERRRALERALPALRSLRGSASPSTTGFLQGQQAIFYALTELIERAKPSEPYCVFAINDKDPGLDLFYRNIAARRKERQLDVMVLQHVAYRVRERHTKVRIRYTGVRLPQGVTIVSDTVLLVSWGDAPTAVRIDDARIAEEWRSFFLDIWDTQGSRGSRKK